MVAAPRGAGAAEARGGGRAGRPGTVGFGQGVVGAFLSAGPGSLSVVGTFLSAGPGSQLGEAVNRRRSASVFTNRESRFRAQTFLPRLPRPSPEAFQRPKRRGSPVEVPRFARSVTRPALIRQRQAFSKTTPCFSGPSPSPRRCAAPSRPSRPPPSSPSPPPTAVSATDARSGGGSRPAGTPGSTLGAAGRRGHPTHSRR